MKNFFIVAVLFILLLCLAGIKLEYDWAYSGQPLHKNHTAVLQAKTSHMLNIAGAHCSLTVIGPHAFITADHCNEDDKARSLTIDNSTRVYHLLGAKHDGRDHVIYLVDGPAFKDIEPYVVRSPKIGESAHIYGFGREVYPAVIKIGKVTDEFDPSEVDKQQGLFYCSIRAIPGDSGANIYGEDGAILGIVTYRNTQEGLLFDKKFSSDFQLDFASKDVYFAQHFDGKAPRISSEPPSSPDEP